MKRLFKALALSAALCFATPTGYAMPEIMPLSEIVPGTVGTLYTVVDLTGEHRSFDAEILGVYRGDAGEMPYILARSEGAFADTDGGVMQGMSGSPVYIDGRLIGAASATLAEMNPHTFLITPIEPMLALWDMPDAKGIRPASGVDLKKIAKARAEAKEKEAREARKTETKQGVAVTENVSPADQLAALQKLKNDAKKADEKKKDDKETEQPAEKKDDKTSERESEKKTDNEKASDDALDTSKAEPKSAVYVSGFGREAQTLLEEKLRPLGLQVAGVGGLGGGTSYTTNYNAELTGGDAVGAALAYGDFAMTAIGTVTAVDGNRVLAFGHPFLHRGNVNYFMTDAKVFGMVNGVTDGRKLAVGTEIIGRINQDRASGISGILGSFPMIVPLRVSVADTTLKRDRTYAASVAYDEALLPAFASIATYAALNRTTDNMAESTLHVHFALRTDAVAEGTIERSNMYYATSDVGKNAIVELATALEILCADTEREANIYDLRVDLSSVAERRTASILSAIPDRPEVRPGDTVNFKVLIKPYRAPKQTVSIPFTVPKRQPDGTMHLEVHGGGLVLLANVLAAIQAANEEQPVVSDEDRAKTTENRLQDLVSAPMNNDIVIERGRGPLPTERELQKSIREAIRRQEEEDEARARGEVIEPEEPPHARYATDYVIDNHVSATLRVSKKAPLVEVEAPEKEVAQSETAKDKAQDGAKNNAEETAQDSAKASAKETAKDATPAAPSADAPTAEATKQDAPKQDAPTADESKADKPQDSTSAQENPKV